MNTHTDNNVRSIFTCRSISIPKVVISLADNIPESVKVEKKKGYEFLPGEKLLISLAKQKKKSKKKKDIDVDRISKSMSRVLSSI
jgi:hypothetical protein